MSVRNSSWCCCSWLIPSSTRSSAAGGSEGRALSSASSTWPRQFAHLVERWPADHPALGPRMAVAFALVIRVEQISEALVEQAGSPAHGRAARRSRRTRWCGRGAIWPARRRGRAGSSRRRRTAARRDRASARASPEAARRANRHYRLSGGAGLPQYVSSFGLRQHSGQNEQMVGKSIEVDEGERIERHSCAAVTALRSARRTSVRAR